MNVKLLARFAARFVGKTQKQKSYKEKLCMNGKD